MTKQKRITQADRLVVYVSQHPGITTPEVCDALNSDSGSTGQQLAVLVQRGVSISTRQVRSLLGCDIKEAYDRLKRLTLAGIVKNVGKPHHPEYRLTHRWRSRVAPAACPPAPQTAAQICREKW